MHWSVEGEKGKIHQALDSKVALVDSGEAIARRVKVLLGIESKESVAEGTKQIYASAFPWQEDALNTCLAELGFSPVQVYRFPDA